MNDNENRNDGFFEENFTEFLSGKIPSKDNRQTEQASEPSLNFDFPQPPREAQPEPEIKAEEKAPYQTQGYNPYAAPAGNRNSDYGYNAYSAQRQGANKEPAGRQNENYYETFYEDFEAPAKNKGKRTLGIIVGVFLVICFLIGFSEAIKEYKAGKTGVENATQQTTLPLETETNIIETTQQNSVSGINSVVVAEKVRPGVVGVLVYKNGQLDGEGSGVLWKEDGEYTYIITCAHVIDESRVTYGILLLDGSYYEAEMVGSDARTDIGVLKINETGLDLVEIGDSNSLKIGEPVYAIGNPGGSNYFGSMTDGIVSAIDRSINSTYKMTVIQHSAAINPGNSGGALVNMAGQIIGINSSKISDTEYEGMGFAVPSSIAIPIAQSLLQYKYVPNRPKLGIEYASASAYQLYSLVVSIKGLPQGSLVIAGIAEDSSLNDTEAQVGDLIIAVNGKDMDDSSVLLDLIEKGSVGDTLTLTLCRIEQRTYKTKTFDITITLVEDKGNIQEETTDYYGYENEEDFYYGNQGDFEDFFGDYFGW